MDELFTILLIFFSIIIPFIIILFMVIKNIIAKDPEFSGEPDDYRVDKVILNDNTILYEPWGKRTNGKWKMIYPYSCKTYEEAKKICDKTCHEHTYIISRTNIK